MRTILLFFIFCFTLSACSLINIFEDIDIISVKFVRDEYKEYRFLYMYKLCKYIYEKGLIMPELKGGILFFVGKDNLYLIIKNNISNPEDEIYIKHVYHNSTYLYNETIRDTIHVMLFSVIEMESNNMCVFSDTAFSSTVKLGMISYRNESQSTTTSEINILINNDSIYIIYNTVTGKKIGLYVDSNGESKYLNQHDNQTEVELNLRKKADNVDVLNIPLYYRVYNYYFDNFLIKDELTGMYSFNDELPKEE